MTDNESLLCSMMPKFFWFRDQHTFSGDRIKVSGSVVLGEGTRKQDVRAFVDGKPVQWTGDKESAYANDKFWFVPAERRFLIEFEGTVADPERAVVTVCLAEDVGFLERYSFVQYANWKTMEPTPPVENIERVSGKGASAFNYHNNGASDFIRFNAIAARHGLPVTDKVRVLDWGSGCGRLTRHFIERGVPATGVDIDPDNIRWSAENLPAGKFAVVDLYPPTRFPDGSFDLVIANSVLSHLKLEPTHTWIAEMKRLLRPGGLALLSYHGEFSLCGFTSKTPDFFRNVLQTGFNATLRAGELSEVISDPEYYRQTFMTDAYAREAFGKHFRVEGQLVGVVSRFQNLAVLRA